MTLLMPLLAASTGVIGLLLLIVLIVILVRVFL